MFIEDEGGVGILVSFDPRSYLGYDAISEYFSFGAESAERCEIKSRRYCSLNERIDGWIDVRAEGRDE